MAGKICILSMTPIEDDPRVRRQGQAFHDAGWQVTGLGLAGAKSSPTRWEIRHVTQQNAMDETEVIGSGFFLTLNDVIFKLRIAFRALSETLGAAWRGRKNTLVQTKQLFVPQQMFEEFANKLCIGHPSLYGFYTEGRTIDADIFLANDWYMLPIAMQLAKEKNARFAYDTHEYALEEYRYRWYWRFTKRPMIQAIERQTMRKACVVSAVSPGIAEGMRKDYKTLRSIHAFRNVPEHQNMPFRPCGERINVLYHGIVAPDRGLAECIKSVQYWRPEFHFQLRGPFNSTEIEQELRGLAAEYGVSDRVHFLPRVPMTDMVREANLSDIGISTPPRTSKHNIYALPNKFFEYIQAGLALAIADLPDMGAIVKQYDLGLLIPEVSPESIAQTINGFTRESIDLYKQNNVKAAAELNWETEQQQLLAAYEQALTTGRI